MPHRTVVPAVMVEVMVEAMAVTVQEDDPVIDVSGRTANYVDVYDRI